MFPNPSDDFFNLKVDVIDFSEGEVKIIDISGRQLDYIMMDSNAQTIDITKLQAGLYFLNLSFVTNNIPVHCTKIFVKK
jgi:hypothetical protein